uniref:Arp2/3 complex 34 kDa subunit n=1 Tax=Hyaloperonospora arabidopsidis (strain Emoy2) TaxID=559515 RepID=M4BUZ9_HYAAE
MLFLESENKIIKEVLSARLGENRCSLSRTQSSSTLLRRRGLTFRCRSMWISSLRKTQEFVDTRRTVNNAPPVAFGKDPPLELRGAPGLRNSPDLVGYLSLAIFPTHVDTTEKRIKAATLVQSLRNYLHYHIKASKTYLHIRMRKRVDLLLQVLNRARPEKDQSKTQKKTITGRTFARA